MKDLFCESCSLQFDKEYVFDVHMKLVHKNTNYSADIPQSKIDKTVKKENGDLGGEAAFEGIHNFTTKDNMNKHNNAIHEEKKPHKCSICDYSSTTHTPGLSGF